MGWVRQRQQGEQVVALFLAIACLLGVGGVALVVGVPASATTEIDDPILRVATTNAPNLPTTTASTTTTAPPLPVPQDGPADPYAWEPEIVLGSIEIPKLGLAVPLNEGISLVTIDRGPSHWPGTAMPGQAGNVVVAGHRVTHTHPFRHIDSMVPGDEVLFTVDGVRHRYVMTANQIVTPDQTEIVAQTPGKTATLFACHPPGSARYRFVVHLEYAGTVA